MIFEHTRNAPFRADHVGSLLRPAELKEARARRQRGEIDAEALRAIEDRWISEAVLKQQRVGLQSITDGEFRRGWWNFDFLGRIEGIEVVIDPTSQRFAGLDEPRHAPVVRGKLRHARPVMLDDFSYLASITQLTSKFCIPSPATLYHRGGRAGISREAYPDLAEFWGDLAAVYRSVIHDLAAAGCRYLQIDDTSFSILCDETFRASCRVRGDDPDALPGVYAKAINDAIAHRPEDMAVTMHTCRGNLKSTWLAQGGYEPVAEEVFNTAAVDGFFLEYDTDRAGGFEPLRYVPPGKKVVLGLVTTKTPVLEDQDALKRKIDAAAKYVRLSDLCLSPQCGFASTHHGNNLSEDEQWRKLELVVTVAGDVWK